jgi:hypothetical protein
MTIVENEAWKAKNCLMEIYLEKSQRGGGGGSEGKAIVDSR